MQNRGARGMGWCRMGCRLGASANDLGSGAQGAGGNYPLAESAPMTLGLVSAAEAPGLARYGSPISPGRPEAVLVSYIRLAPAPRADAASIPYQSPQSNKKGPHIRVTLFRLIGGGAAPGTKRLLKVRNRSAAGCCEPLLTRS